MDAPADARRCAVDIGGTFTDLVLVDTHTGSLYIEKTPTTPDNLWTGIADGLRRAQVDAAALAMLVHGTTVGLNTFLEKKGAPVGLITTAGFRDVYEIGRVNRIDMYDLFYRKPEPLVPREHRLEVRERIGPAGEVIEPLVEDDVRAAADHFRRHGIRAIAVCLLHSYANPAHEERVAALLEEYYPEAQVSVSNRLAREWREYERTSTTVINAYIAPRVSAYLAEMEAGLAGMGYRRPLFIHKSSGGVMSVRTAQAQPVHTIMSGPAGGSVAAAFVGRQLGFENVIAFDMGGTSTDVSVAWQGELRVTAEAKFERHPVMVPMVDIHSVGAGGGSIAWVDPQGALQVGPQSAGSVPGPACYGRGGREATVTDANLLLGRLRPVILGGAMTLDRDLAHEAVAAVARSVGLDVTAAAAGIIRIVNTKMSHAIRAITVERGLDPKDFALVAFGGAGPMHACALAEELNVARVVVPVLPGAFSALGMLAGDVRHDAVRTRPQPTEAADPASLAGEFEAMEQELAAVIADEVGGQVPVDFQRFIEMRYAGQEYVVRVPVPAGRPFDRDLLADVRADFDRLHEQAYGHASSTEPTEIINLRVAAFGRLPRLELPTLPAGGEAPPDSALIDRVECIFDHAAGPLPTPVYAREELLAGNRLPGPAIVVEKGATTVLNPGFHLTVSERGHLVIDREGR